MKTLLVMAGAALGLGGLWAGPAEPPKAETFKIDPVHSTVIFRIKHMGVSYVYGRFNDVEGAFSLNDGKPEDSKLDVTIPIESLDTNDKKRDQHLKGPDFFNAKQFPKIHFKGRTFKKSGDARWEITGDLSLHGVDKSVTVTVEHVGTGKGPQGDVRSGLESTFEIKRSDYGMKFMLGGVGDDVRLIVGMEGIRQ